MRLELDVALQVEQELVVVEDRMKRKYHESVALFREHIHLAGLD